MTGARLFIALARTSLDSSRVPCGKGLQEELWRQRHPQASTLMKMDPGVLKKADPPVPPVWRAPTVPPSVDLLVANEGRVMVPSQDRSRRRRWPKASLYKGPSPGHARPTDGHVGVCPARECPREPRQSAPGWWVRKMSTPWVHSRERQGQERCRSNSKWRLMACLGLKFLVFMGLGF